MRRRSFKMFLVVAIALVPTMLASVGAQAVIPPRIVAAQTLDADANGSIDTIRLTFSVTMNTNSTPLVSDGESPGFHVEGYQIIGFDWTGSMSLDIILAEGSEPDTDATPVVHYISGDGGAVTSPLGTELGNSEVTPLDRAGPVLVAAHARTVGSIALFDNEGDELFLTFSEPTILAGLTKTDRWMNLERAIRFVTEPSQIFGPSGGCPVDGDGVQTWNFPQPRAGNPSGTDPILSPKGPASLVSSDDDDEEEDGDVLASRVFHIRLGNPTTDHIASNRLIPGIPDGCRVGVDPGTQLSEGSGGLLLNRATLTDAAGNIAVPMTPENGGVRIFPTGVEAQSGKTRDLNENGVLDAIDLKISHNVDPDTINQPFTIRLGSTTLQPTSTELAGGDTIRIRFNAPSSWTTAVTPSISYTKPSNCEALGLKVRIESWSMCIPSFTDLESLDRAGPVLLEAKTADAGQDGSVDSINLTFNEAVTNTADVSEGWTVNGQDVSSMAIDPEDGRKATLSLDPPIEGTGVGATLSYEPTPPPGQQGSMDVHGNQVAKVEDLQVLDGAAPRILSASQDDTTGNGNIDTVELTLSEAIVAPSSAAGFTVGGQSASLKSISEDATEITLSVSGLTGTDTKDVVYSGSAGTIKDAAGNLAISQTIEASEVEDKARPVGVVTVQPNAPIPAGEATIVVTYSEPMDTSIEPDVVFVTDQGSKDITSHGWSEDERSWSGTLTIVEEDCSESTGCPVVIQANDARDPSGNLQLATAILATKIDTVAPDAPVLGSLTTSVKDGETAPEGTLNMFSTGLSLSAAIEPGQATDGVARILLNGEPIPGATDSSIGENDTSVQPSTSFSSPAALQEAIPEGTHELTVELCDQAMNCAVAADAVEIVAHYTPEATVGLVEPNTWGVRGGTSLPITWDLEGEADGVVLRYSQNGGATFPHVIANGLDAADGSFEWTVPSIDASQVVVRAEAIDPKGNKAFGDSDAFVVRTKPVFSDVGATYWARKHIEALSDANVTGGCSSTRYCPGNEVTRAQMAVFLIRVLGEHENLAPYQGTFSDVPASNFAARHIERLADLGLTGGCGGGRFCPGNPVTRAEMSVFIIRAMGEHDNLESYKGMFSDVPASHFAARHVERMAVLGVTAGCGGGRFCPSDSVTRAQMAVFMAKAFDLPILD